MGCLVLFPIDVHILGAGLPLWLSCFRNSLEKKKKVRITESSPSIHVIHCKDYFYLNKSDVLLERTITTSQSWPDISSLPLLDPQ